MVAQTNHKNVNAMLRGKKSVKIDEQLEDNRMAVRQKKTKKQSICVVF